MTKPITKTKVKRTIKGYGWKGVVICEYCDMLQPLDKEHECKEQK